MRVESRTGGVRARLRTRAGQRRDILVGERGGWLKAGHGLNRLTGDTPSTVGRGAPYYETWWGGGGGRGLKNSVQQP